MNRALRAGQLPEQRRPFVPEPKRRSRWPAFLIALWAVCCACGPAAADAPDPFVTDPGDKLQVSLLTFGPGSIYWQRFGHNAILVEDGAEAYAFNYGVFDFRQQDFMLNFARGRMLYRMDVDMLADVLGVYTTEGRWVQQQRLLLLPPQRAALRDFLVWNAQPENRNYRYDYFLSNCSTRVRDALDRALGGALRPQLEARATAATYRSDAVRLLWPDHWLALGMDLALGPSAAQPLNLWQESFVPTVLMQALREVQVRGADGRLQPLVTSEQRLRDSSMAAPPPRPPDLRGQCLALGTVLGALLFLLARLHRRRSAAYGFAATASLYLLACAAGGLILAGFWGLTEHWAGWRNENLLLLNPGSALLLPACLTAPRRGFRPSRFALLVSMISVLLAAAALSLHLLPVLHQDNMQWIALFLPAHLGLALGLRAARGPLNS